jgi:hypothetical protein
MSAWQHHDAKIPKWRKVSIVEGVAVVGQENTVVGPSPGRHILVGVAIQTQLVNVTGVPALVSENLGDLRAQALVHKKARLPAELADECRDLTFWSNRNSLPRHGSPTLPNAQHQLRREVPSAACCC